MATTTASDGRPSADGTVCGLEITSDLGGGRFVVRAADEGRELGARVVSGRELRAALANGLGALPDHAHRENLVDVGVEPAGAVLITTPPVVATLDEVLASERAIPPGVIVTLLAPIVAALRDSSRAGVLLAPGAEAVGLTVAGRPVLLASSAVRADSDAVVHEAAAALLARCRERCPDWPSMLEAAADLDEIEAALFRSAEPLPLGGLLHARVPAPIVEDAPAHVPRRVPPWVERLRRRGAGSARRDRDGATARHRRVHPLDGWRRRAAALARRRRGPLAVAGVIALGSIVAATAGAGTSPEQGLRAPNGTTPTALPSTTAGGPRLPPPDASPEEAADLLVSAAALCADERSDCLEALTTPDSALRGRGAARTADLLPAGSAVSTVVAEVDGASALVSVHSGGDTPTASVLIIRTEAGWLIRGVFSGEGL